MKPRRHARRVFSLAAASALAAALPSGCRRASPYAALEGAATFVTREAPLTISVNESGTIQPREREIIKCELEGRTTILFLIPEGTRVRQGDLLVELDASSLQDQKVDQEIRVQNAEASFIQSREELEVTRNQAQSDTERAELDLRFAREDLDQYRDGEYPNDLKELQARLTLAREDLSRAQEKLKWTEVLYKEQYVSESEYRADELALKRAALDVELAENELALLQDFTVKRRTAELESDARQAELALARVRRKASASIVQAEADLRAKESEYNRQTDKLRKIEAQITKARIVAPRDGLVVYATSTEFRWHGTTEPLAEGQEVREMQELIHLPTASTFLAKVSLHESALNRVAVGQPVQVTVDAIPGRVFRGTVASIAPLPDPTSVFMNPDLKLYSTEITLDGDSQELRTGMSCKVEIIVATFDRAVQIPVQAVVREDGEPTVYVRDRGGFQPRRVKAGQDNNRMMHILDGLKPGEVVSLAPPFGEKTRATGAPPPRMAGERQRPAAGQTR